MYFQLDSPVSNFPKGDPSGTGSAGTHQPYFRGLLGKLLSSTELAESSERGSRLLCLNVNSGGKSIIDIPSSLGDSQHQSIDTLHFALGTMSE